MSLLGVFGTNDWVTLSSSSTDCVSVGMDLFGVLETKDLLTVSVDSVDWLSVRLYLFNDFLLFFFSPSITFDAFKFFEVFPNSDDSLELSEKFDKY